MKKQTDREFREPREVSQKQYKNVKKYLGGAAAHRREWSWRRLRYRYYVWLWVVRRETENLYFAIVGYPQILRSGTGSHVGHATFYKGRR